MSYGRYPIKKENVQCLARKVNNNLTSKAVKKQFHRLSVFVLLLSIKLSKMNLDK